jgi:predicted ATPase
MIVLTGGPGAGKTAVLNLVRQRLCHHVYVVEESASILFGGGFPRDNDVPARRAAQRAIYHVQSELERIAHDRPRSVLAVCDRGTLDGIAYWPGDDVRFLEDLGTTMEAELSRYAMVIHLRTPPAAHYNHDNALRIESAAEAQRIDDVIWRVWANHPRRVTIDSDDDFLKKAERAVELVEQELRAACPQCADR